MALSSANAETPYCRVLDFSPFESVRPTRDASGLILPQQQKCARITFENKGIQIRYATSFSVTAIFENGTQKSSWAESEEDRFKRLEPGEIHTTYNCFGPSDSEIVSVECE